MQNGKRKAQVRQEQARRLLNMAHSAGLPVLRGRLFARDTITVTSDLTEYGLHAEDGLVVIVLKESEVQSPCSASGFRGRSGEI